MTSRRQNPFVAEVVDEFLRLKSAREPKTFYAYSGVLRGSEHGTKKPLGLPFAVYFHNRKFRSLTHDDAAAWFGQRVHGGAQNTKHRVSKTSRHFLDWAYRQGYSPVDLSAAVPAFRQGQARQTALDWDTVDQVLAAIPAFRFRFAAAWLFYTGCRVGEAIQAKQADVQWHAEAGLYIWTIPAETKTHNAREVWLPPVLADLLEEARRQNKPRPEWPLLWDCEGRGFGRVENPAAPITPKTINNALDQARDALGLTVPLHAHICRHTYCTNWVQTAGRDEMALEKLSRQVGASVAVLRNTYVHHRLGASDWEVVRLVGRTSSGSTEA